MMLYIINSLRVILLILLSTIFGHTVGNVYYIVPSQDNSCFPRSCITLSYFANNYDQYNADPNMTLLISEGNHSLNVGFSVSNVVEFSMLSVNDTLTSLVIICDEGSNFNFSNIDSVNMNGLTFVGCGGSIVESVDQITIQRSRFVGYKNSTTSMTIIGSNASLTETIFASHQVGSHRNSRYQLPFSSDGQYSIATGAMVGGALIVTHSTLVIDNCQFEENSANMGGAIFSERESNIIIRNSTFISNRATSCQNELCYGGALFVHGTGKVSIFECNFENNTSDRDGGMAAIFNATLLVSHCYIDENTATRYGGAVALYQRSNLSISESTSFYHNLAGEEGGTLYAELDGLVSIDNSTFVNNSAIRGGAICAKNLSNS